MNAVAKWFRETFTLSYSSASDTATPATKRTVTGTISDGHEDLRKQFFAQPDDPNEKRTHLQDRMQSGGA